MRLSLGRIVTNDDDDGVDNDSFDDEEVGDGKMVEGVDVDKRKDIGFVDVVGSDDGCCDGGSDDGEGRSDDDSADDDLADVKGGGVKWMILKKASKQDDTHRLYSSLSPSSCWKWGQSSLVTALFLCCWFSCASNNSSSPNNEPIPSCLTDLNSSMDSTRQGLAAELISLINSTALPWLIFSGVESIRTSSTASTTSPLTSTFNGA